MSQLVQILGSLLVVTAFAAAQRGALSTESRAYLVLNLTGSVVLAVLAAHEHQGGFLPGPLAAGPAGKDGRCA